MEVIQDLSSAHLPGVRVRICRMTSDCKFSSTVAGRNHRTSIFLLTGMIWSISFGSQERNFSFPSVIETHNDIMKFTPKSGQYLRCSQLLRRRGNIGVKFLDVIRIIIPGVFNYVIKF
jgi:hypothetical protein